MEQEVNGRLQSCLRRWSISHETLGLFRILLGSIILADLILRSLDLTYFYSDAGILPREYLLRDFLNANRLSVHLLGGSAVVQGILFAINGAFALMLILGWKSRLATVACWFLLISVQNRNPLAIHGGDDVLRLITFWAMFLPLGKSYGIDSRQGPAAGVPAWPALAAPWAPWLHFLASMAMRIQVVSIYWCIIAARNHPEWLREGTAVYYALQLDQFLTPLGHFLREALAGHVDLYPFMTWGVMSAETLGPLFLLMPFPAVRLAAVAAMSMMHLSFGATMYLGVFPFIDVVSLAVFLDRRHVEFLMGRSRMLWLRCGAAVAARAPWLRDCWCRPQGAAVTAQAGEAGIAGVIPPRAGRRRVVQAGGGFAVFFCAYCLWYVCSLNLCQLEYFNCRIADAAKSFGQAIYLQQHWSMFSPYPLKDDGFYEMPGILRNGDKVDVFLALDSGADVVKPRYLAHQYRGDRHRKYMMNLWLKRNREARLPYGRYLCRAWNRAAKRQGQLVSYKIIFHKETPRWGMPPTVKPVTIWEHQCFG